MVHCVVTIYAAQRHYDIRLTVRPLNLSTVLVRTTWYFCTRSRRRPPPTNLRPGEGGGGTQRWWKGFIW